MQIKITSNL